MSDTILRLSALRSARGRLRDPSIEDRLTDFPDFGPNPGSLRARIFVPDELPAGAPLMVVLHGCTQTAAEYDHGSGWSALAEHEGFALLYAEQSPSNNPNNCFNWFNPADARRDAGEAASIRHMIEALMQQANSDPNRVYITGLSAGGAMTAVMLACYPEMFAGGAIVAGLPFAAANTIPEAFDRMRGQGLPDGAALERQVRKASDHRGDFPKLSLWQGTADRTVSEANLEALIAQWRGIQGVPAKPTRTERIDGQTRRVWCDADGEARIEAFTIDGMGHGTPLKASGPDALGHAGAYMLDVGISSTDEIARFFGLRTEGTSIAVRPRSAAAPKPVPPKGQPARKAAPAKAPDRSAGIGKVIEDALRAAGLMR